MRPVTDIHQFAVRSYARRNRRARLLAAALSITMLTAAGISMPLRASADQISDKKAEAARVADQVEKLDQQYDELQERYRGAQIRLDDINVRVGELNRDLKATQQQLGVAEGRLTDRVLTVYQSGAANTRLVNLAEAGSVTRFLDRMETIQRVSTQDASILADIRILRTKVAHKRAQLKDAQAEQKDVVADRKRSKDEMGKRVAQRQQVLDSVNAQVRKLVAEEQARRAAAAAAAARASKARAEAAAAASQPSSGGGAPSGAPDPGSAISSPAVAAPPPSGGASSAAGIAMGQIGVPYVWGGASPSGFDCSGLVMWSFGQVGISLPHSTYALYNMGTHVSRDQLQSGDLVFFSGLGHMGIYIGGGSFVHAPHTGDFVKVSSMTGYYSSNYVGAVRI